jgi:hypothetical protein
MRTTALVALAALSAAATSAEPRRLALESAAGLRAHHVKVEAATLDGRKGVRLAISDEAARLPAEQQGQLETVAVVEGIEFGDGAIEAEIAGAPAPGAAAGARGFVGLAFRVQKDVKTYDAFYLRPTNGRADDQERRNHATQYVSHPDWPWHRLRKETPGRYESYVDLVAGAWTKVRIEVNGGRARLFVHGAEQPALVVNDVKSGPAAKGAIALWIGPGTIAHFRDLRVQPAGP